MPRSMPLARTRGVGDEQIVADQLDLLAERVGHHLPAGPIVFGHAVFDRDDRDTWRTQLAQNSTICSLVRSLLSDFLKTYFAVLDRRTRSTPGRAQMPRSARRACSRPARWLRARLRALLRWTSGWEQSRLRRRPRSSSPSSSARSSACGTPRRPCAGLRRSVAAPCGAIMNSCRSTRVVGMRAAVEDVHHRHGQHAGVRRRPGSGRAACCCDRPRRARGGHRNGQNGVGAQPALVGRAVERDHRARRLRACARRVLAEQRRWRSRPLMFLTAFSAPLPR